MFRMNAFACMLFTMAALLMNAGSAKAESDGVITPCGASLGRQSSGGLTPVQLGSVVYDSAQGLCWLADANLAGNPFVRSQVTLASVNGDGSTPVINPDGTMSYQTALNWVAALNAYDNGKGWLGHHNWQLPTTALSDPTCKSYNAGNFGALCTGSALGHLYAVGLGRSFPDCVLPQFFSFVRPLLNLQPGLYWTSGNGAGGQATFSFNNGQSGNNTTLYNYFHVLPMTRSVLGPLPQGSGVQPYASGAAAGKAVYDAYTGLSWTLDANLPARQKFGVTSEVTITSKVDGSVLTEPLVDTDGAVYFTAVDPLNGDATTSWIAAMNQGGYAGAQNWTLPGVGDLQQLFLDMGLVPGDPRLERVGYSSGFWNLQPGFYWSCERTAGTGNQVPCDPSAHPGVGPDGVTTMEYSFNFDNGFEGTDLDTKEFYVMVYYPAPPGGP